MDAYTATKTRVMQLMYEKHLSIHKLAMLSGVPASTIKNILYGKSRNPGVATLAMLCSGMEITITDFFNDEIFNDLDI